VNDVRVEYRVLADGKGCDESAGKVVDRSYAEARFHAKWHEDRGAASTEIQSRTVTTTPWRTEDQP
jgi:hypothetical protein